MSTRERLVIVGGGMAGGKLAEELVARGGLERYDVTVVGDEPCGNYNRIKLVVKLKEPDLPDLFLNTPDWYARVGIRALLGAPAVAIDRSARTVATADGQRLAYDRLVLATGSRPIVPPMPGLDLPGVGGVDAREHPQQGRLAGTVEAENHDP